MLSLYEIKNILNPKRNDDPEDDFRIIQSWAEYDENSAKTPECRNLEYLCYEIEVLNPDTGKTQHFYKAIKFARVIRLPANAKQSTSLMDMQEQILAGVHDRNYNLITIIANIIKPVAIGLLYLYGVQGVSESLEEAKKIAHSDFIGFIGMMQGTFRVLELKCVEAQETEWLREKMYGMDYLTVVRGLPKASKAGEDAGNKGVGAQNVNPDSQGTLEEIISGMADYEYVIEVLSTPVYHETLEGWQRQSQKQMSDWYGQMQGTKSLSMNLSIPMMYMANASQSQGWSKAYTDANTVSYSNGESFTATQGQSVGESLSQSYGQTIGHTEGTTLTNSVTQGVTQSQGVSASEGMTYGQSVGSSHSISEGISSSYTEGISENTGISQNTGLSQGMNFSRSQGNSFGVSAGQNIGSSHNVGMNENIGYSQNASASLSNSASYGQSEGSSLSQGISSSAGHSSSIGKSDGGSWSESGSLGLSNTYTSGSSHNTSEGSSLGGSITPIGLGVNTGSNFSTGMGTSQSSSTGTNNSDSWSQGGSLGYSQSDGTSFTNGASAGSSISSGLSSSKGETIGQSEGFGLSQSYGASESFGESVGESLGTNWGTNTSESLGQNVSMSNSYGISQGTGHNIGRSNSQNLGQSFGVTQSESLSQSQSVSRTSSTAQSLSLGKSLGQSVSDSVSSSETHGTSQSTTQSTSVSNGTTYSKSNGSSIGSSTGTTGTASLGTASSMGLGPSIGYSKSYQWLDQGVKDLIELLEYQNTRIKKALMGEGAFYTYVYIACPSLDALSAAQALAKSTWQNDYAMVNPLQVLDLSEGEQKHLLYHFAAFSSDVSKENVNGVEEYKYCTVLLPEEYVAYTHLPRVSEGGVFSVILDIPKFSVPSLLKGEIYMGTILNPERYTFNNGYRTPYDYRIDESMLMHGYFTGASRSGKTVAATRFIAELSRIRRKKTGKRMRIVVMDPKQDWRTLARFVDASRFNFFSMGNVNFRPIKINVWKVPEGVWPQIWIDGVIDIYCRAYGLLERGKQMIATVVYALYEEAGVFEACDREDWKERVPELSSQVTFKAIYKRMERERDALTSAGKSGNDTKDAYARLLERLSCFGRDFSIESRLYGTSEGIGIDDMIGEDDVTVLESKGLENTFKNFIFGVVTSGFYKYAIAHEGGYLAEDQYETVLVIEEANEVLTGNDAAGSSGKSGQASLSGQSEFEQILDQSAGYGLFIIAITQKIADMPSSIVANSGIIFAGKLNRPDDINVVVRAIGKEERIDDRDVVKWFPNSPIGWFVCKTGRNYDFKEAAPILVQISRLNINPPSNIELDEILTDKEIRKKYA